MNTGRSFVGAVSSQRFRKILIWTLILLVIYTITGFLILPPVVKSILQDKLSEKLRRAVTIQKLKINPFMLSAEIKGFEIKDLKGPETFISFDDLYVNLQSMSIFKKGVILSELRLNKPYLRIVRNEDLTYNFSDLSDTGGNKTPTNSEPLKFSVNNIQITGGKVNFYDLPKHASHVMSEINAAIPFISNFQYYVDTYVTPSFEAKLNDRQISLKGETKPFSDTRETIFDVQIKDLDIPYYLNYVPLKKDYKVNSAYLDVNSIISFAQLKDRPPIISLKGDVKLKKIDIADGEKNPLLKIPSLDISFEDADLLLKKIHLGKVLLDSPEINVVRDRSGRINLKTFIPEKPEKEEKKSTEKEQESLPLAIEVNDIGVTQGKIFFSDMPGSTNFKTDLEQIDVKVENFSNIKYRISTVAVSLQTESNENVKLTGQFSLDPLAAVVSVGLDHILMKKYSPYYRDKILFDIKDAVLDLNTQCTFRKIDDIPQIKLSKLTASLVSLKLRRRGDDYDFLSIPAVDVKNTEIDLTNSEVTAGDITTDKGVLNIRRLNDGALNVQRLIPPAPASEKQLSAPSDRKEDKPFLFTIKNLQAARYTVNYEDPVPAEPVKLTAGQIKIKGENLSTEKNTKGKVSLSLKLNRTGAVTIGGTIRINPLSASMSLNLKNVEVGPFQPYFTDRIKVIVTSGSVSGKGNISINDAGEKGPRAAFKGDASLTNFVTVDKLNSDDFLKWQSLYVSGIDAGYNPLYVNIKDIALSDFYSRLIVNEDGTLNVQGVFHENKPKDEKEVTAPPDEAKTAPAEEKKPAPVKIDTLTLQGGAINFSDNHIKPHYSVNLLEIGGRVSGLSSEENTTADVDLRGKLENYAPLEITGRINPLKQDLFVDLKADFKDMDLSPLSPYSGRYVGYTIEKGKLALNLRYLIVKKKLDSQNNVFLDQFTLGDAVESPEATKLPVKLAIALLKDRQGRINLDIPVTGELDDPKFSIGGVILKIIKNLLVKAATSPFALLGAIFGGGEELSYLQFDYGSHVISEEGAKKLDTIIKMLNDRPSLKIEIKGFVDPEKDREGLIQYIFHKKIKAQKLKDLVKKGQSVTSVDEIQIEPEEYSKYLKMAYKQEKFPKPRNFLGFAKDLPDPEMEKLMLTHIEIKDDDLRQLASQRSLNVKDYILRSKKVEPERVFLVQTKTLKPEQKEKVKDSRVEFKLE